MVNFDSYTWTDICSIYTIFYILIFLVKGIHLGISFSVLSAFVLIIWHLHFGLGSVFFFCIF